MRSVGLSLLLALALPARALADEPNAAPAVAAPAVAAPAVAGPAVAGPAVAGPAVAAPAVAAPAVATSSTPDAVVARNLRALVAPSAPDLVATDEARSTRATGIGLFAGGLAVTIASQVLTGVAIGFSTCLNPYDDVCATHPDLNSYIIGAAVSTVAGNAMLATGLALWGIGNRRLATARLAGVALAPGRDGATASLRFRF